jgi:hypothetical protein
VRLAATALFAALLVGGLGLVFSSWALERPLVIWPALAATMLICGALIGAFERGKRRARDGAVAVFVVGLLVQGAALARHAQGGPISLCLIGQLVLVAIAVRLLYGRRARRWFAAEGGTASGVARGVERAGVSNGHSAASRTVGPAAIVDETNTPPVSRVFEGQAQARRRASG